MTFPPAGAGPGRRLTVPVSQRDHVRGDLAAQLTLVEYGDYECPYCRAAHPVVREVERLLDGQLRFVYRHFPIVSAHPHAVRAAEAAEAAGAQGGFWPMHDRLYESNLVLADEILVRLAIQIGVDAQRFVADLAAGNYLDRIREDMASGQQSGVTGTPTFFVNGIRYDGPRAVASLVGALQRTASAPAL
jgi:protein-disulfide isomerase